MMSYMISLSDDKIKKIFIKKTVFNLFKVSTMFNKCILIFYI